LAEASHTIPRAFKMEKYLNTKSRNISLLYTSLELSWLELCKRYLPVVRENSLWRFSRESSPEDPEQGWKLHLSATILDAIELLKKVGPELSRRGVLFKAPASLREVDRLNSGIYYGYSQVGKVLTVYPRNTTEAVELAKLLNRLTYGIKAPSVPFDRRYRARGTVFYRYGAFTSLEISEPGRKTKFAIKDPAGNLVEDNRQSEAKPEWINDPFVQRRITRTKSVITPLQTTFKAFRALSQRGKGGVYQALDFSVDPARLCVIKQGRKNGETTWDGRDGYSRVNHEAKVLALLNKQGLDVPKVYSAFKLEGAQYLVTEFIHGEDLESWLLAKQRRVSLSVALRLCVQISDLLSRLHSLGWVWRDCKPRNLIIQKNGTLRPIDFEGACLVDKPDPLPFGTTSYLPPEWNEPFRGQSRLPEDLYALGSVMYLIVAGCPPDAEKALPIEEMRRGLPSDLITLINQLLSSNPQSRPTASEVTQRLVSCF